MADIVYTKMIKDGQIFHNLLWVNRPMRKTIFNKYAAKFKASNNYKLMSIKEMRDYIKSDIDIDQIISLRNIVVKDKIIKRYSLMNDLISQISQEYNSGATILELSRRYDFPPLNLLRGILLNNGYDASDLYAIFANKIQPDILKGRDLQEYKCAEINDAESTFNQQQITHIAALNETKFVNYIKSLGIPLKTQEDLAAEQKIQYGMPILTPDILFMDDVYINGVKVMWIDYKDYLGTNINFLYSSNVKQSAKYTDRWGPGAFCYSKSYVDGLKIAGAILLDGRACG